MTNYEKIKSLSLEEMAAINVHRTFDYPYYDDEFCTYCPQYTITCKRGYEFEFSAKLHEIEWLQQEYNPEEWNELFGL